MLELNAINIMQSLRTKYYPIDDLINRNQIGSAMANEMHQNLEDLIKSLEMHIEHLKNTSDAILTALVERKENERTANGTSNC